MKIRKGNVSYSISVGFVDVLFATPNIKTKKDELPVNTIAIVKKG